MDPDRIEAVLFDLDDTLSVYRRGQAELLDVAFERAGVEPFFDAETYVQRYDEYYGDGDVAVDRLRERCFTAICRDLDRDPALGRELARHYAAERDQANVRYRRGADAALAGIGGDVPIAVVTNGDRETQRTKLDALGLRGQVNHVVYGGVETDPKPDPAPFERALEALNVPADRAVHVGNSLVRDVAGAHAAGIRSVWAPRDRDLPTDVESTDALTPGHDAVEPEPDHLLADLRGLPDVLDGRH